jgi:ATP-binding cassette subfamily C protein CydCD
VPTPLDPRLVRYAGGVRTLLLGEVAVAAGTALLVVAPAFCRGDVVSRVFLEGATLSDVSGVVLALALVVLGRVVLATLGESLAQRAATTTSAQLRSVLLAHIVRLGPVWLSGERRAQMATLATRGIDSIEPYVARYLPQLVIAASVPLTVGIAIMTQDFLAAVIVALTAPLIPVFMVLIGMYTQTATAKQWSTLSVLSGHFLDVVSGLPTLKAFGRQDAQSERMKDVDAQYRTATMGVLRISFLSSFVLELLATVSVAIVAVSIGLRLVDGTLDLRTGLTVLILAPEVYLPIRAVGAQFHAAADGIDAAEQVFAVLDTEPATTGTATVVPRGPITVDAVSITYPGTDVVALAPLSLVLVPGRIPAFVGPSGGGKSTLLAALQGFVAPSSGAIRVGDVDLATLDPAAWRRTVAVVAQDPVLVGPSIADDVRMRRPDASPDEVLVALRDAGLDPSTLPDGARTLVGDLANDVSAGQRRRVALARVLLEPAPLVLLDEPTAGLDDDAENDVVEAVRRLADAGCAVVVVAHRPSLVAGADEIVTLEPAAAVA